LNNLANFDDEEYVGLDEVRFFKTLSLQAMRLLRYLIALYEAWNKPEKAEEWQAKLPHTEAVEE